ncbi:MAG: glycosyltransferase, partial [Bacteroidetes bacterium]|nr:glycosyltransferase [Bacteroidota bacterium]
LAIARNEGIRRVKGKYILFIDGDATADKNWLSNYIDVFKSTDCDFSSGRIELLNEESSFAKLLQESRFKQSLKATRSSNYLHGVNMAFKKEVMDQYKGFYENFTSRGDDTSFSFLIQKDKTWAPSIDSIVHHERPESFSIWWSFYTKELSISIMAFRVITNTSTRYGLKHSIPFAKSVLFNSIIITSIFFHEFWVAIFLSIPLLKSGVFFTSYGGIKYYGFAAFIACTDLVMRTYYISAGFIKNIGVEIIPPFTSTPEVLLYKSNL